ncbi:SGNH/GDSL hydrolase family protein [Haloflavibacter putidus]|uniref:SGNH/GDSL hydrolase family protein n=1 Tax=Haloflavibacter putidus TaxID=2576776 RepID=A0A507ZVH2_9FLAO|nr:SGNH/GDSL hydrolase family protein [Haloflavibacter putidus]TQD38795.1 SGNH/GDSL hydrolase family protein [Haloflavibacter putidus]
MQQFSFLVILSIYFCLGNLQAQEKQSLRYLALGDSYTIGEKVAPQSRWPVQLAKALNKEETEVEETHIIAQTGWRTDNLLNAIDTTSVKGKFDLVSLLIGVNNQYQGKEISQFKSEFEGLLTKAIVKSKEGAKGVFVVSIPDYSVTPFVTVKHNKIRKEIKQYNRIARKMSKKYKIAFVNITPISQKAKKDKSLLAEDGLHPSPKMYAQWVKKIQPVVIEMCKKL